MKVTQGECKEPSVMVMIILVTTMNPLVSSTDDTMRNARFKSFSL